MPLEDFDTEMLEQTKKWLEEVEDLAPYVVLQETTIINKEELKDTIEEIDEILKTREEEDE